MSKFKNHACKTLPPAGWWRSKHEADQHHTCAPPDVAGRGSAPSFEPSLSRQSGQALIKAMLMVALLGGAFGLALRTLQAQTVIPPDPPAPLASLKTVPVPGPTTAELAEFVLDKSKAIQLGKALFWDMKVGSDNNTACASCHFHAGADHRTTNTLNPGQLAGDSSFQLGGPNYTLTQYDFPFTKHVLEDRVSQILSDINDVAGSQGVYTANFTNIGAAGGSDLCADVPNNIFHGNAGAKSANTRQVTGRNTPTAINAVFNFRNFWDGRANNMFNGGDPFGRRNPNALVWKLVNGTPMQVKVAIPSSSTASQGDGPPLSSVEMSCAGRSFMKLGKKLLGQMPLSSQSISYTDSVLASMAVVRPTYADLIKKAFQPAYWNSPVAISTSGADALKWGSMDLYGSRIFSRDMSSYQVSQMEANFALFFGLAIQMYESTLLANDTPFDQYKEGKTTALTAQQKQGLALFEGKGGCINCHSGAVLTNASFPNVLNQRLEKMLMAHGEAVYDNGFYNIGVRPTTDDIGVGGKDPFGNPLSETKIVQEHPTDAEQLLGNGFKLAENPAVPPGQRVAVDGAFKTPGLRNVEFTGPYFHNGGKATLMQVVDFYNRGGDFADVNQDNLAPNISPIGFTESEKTALVAFLLALSDERVRYQKAPFDHPSLCVPNGHQAYPSGELISVANTIKAVNNMQCLPAVGRYGAQTGLETFLRLYPFQR